VKARTGATAKARTRRWEGELRKFALGFPEATEEFPWGHSAFKVRGKVFLFLSSGEKGEGGLSLSVKLPGSRAVALMLPFAEPTGYGLGRSGWVSARFGEGKQPPLPMLREWIAESYRAIAPKRLLAAAEPAPAAAAPTRRRAKAPRR
jgi:predicted DNA-binding protein (MmcQ/YjbR family)